MIADWPRVPLGEVLTHRKDFVVIDDLRPYKRCRVQLHAQGVVLRDEVPGAEIKTKKQQVCRPGEFLVAEIDAKLGGFGMVPPDLDGAIVSSHYFLFPVIDAKLDRQFLDYYIRTADFRDQVTAQGSTNYAAIRPSHVLAYTMPLPPLDEQRRIVSRVDALAARIAAARQLREEADAEGGSVFAAGLADCWRDAPNWNEAKVGDLVETVSGQVDPRLPQYAAFPLISGDSIESGTCRLLASYRTAEGDGAISGKYHFPANTVLYSKIRPYLRKATFVPFESLCSADIYAFASISPLLEPRFLMYSLVSPAFTEYAVDLSGRTRMPKLNQDQLFAYRLPFPPIAEQRRIVAHLDALQAKADALKALQSESAAELNALLPAVLAAAFAGKL